MTDKGFVKYKNRIISIIVVFILSVNLCACAGAPIKRYQGQEEKQKEQSYNTGFMYGTLIGTAAGIGTYLKMSSDPGSEGEGIIFGILIGGILMSAGMAAGLLIDLISGNFRYNTGDKNESKVKKDDTYKPYDNSRTKEMW